MATKAISQSLLDAPNGEQPSETASRFAVPEVMPTLQPASACKNLREAQLWVMRKVGYVQKTPSPQLGYAVITEQDVLIALRPAMVEAGIVCYPISGEVKFGEYVTGRGSRMETAQGWRVFRFEHVSGDFRDIHVFTGAANSGDKAAGVACTYARKMALREMFCLETGLDELDVIEQRDSPNSDLYKRARAAIMTAPTKEAAAEKLETCLAVAQAEWTEDQRDSLKRVANNWQPKAPPKQPAGANL